MHLRRVLLAVIATGVFAHLVGACSSDRPPPAGSGNTGTPRGPMTATPVNDAGPTTGDAAVSGGACPPPPFSCDRDAGSDAALFKEGGGTGSVGACTSGEIGYGTRQLAATGPTGAFVTAYNEALASTHAGPFVLVARHFNAGAPGYVVGAAGATSASMSTARPTEPGLEGAATLAGRTMTLSLTEDLFHLAFTRDLRPEGDLEVRAIALTGMFPAVPACDSLGSVSVTLYIPATQASVPFGGATVGGLLGSPSPDIGGTGFSGWAVPLGGPAEQVVLQ